MESSLTTPSDRDASKNWKPDTRAPELTHEELDSAIETLEKKDFTKRFPVVERIYADPTVPNQTIGLISFVPAKGATPNERGVYGFAKIRGNYGTEIEASQRAEELLKKDSYHEIFHAYVGRPFPITNDARYCAETDEVNVKSDMKESISAQVKAKRAAEKADVDDIKKREEELLADVEKDEDPYETYVTMRVKKAQLVWTYTEHQKKMAEVKEIIIKTRAEIAEADEKNPEFKESYYQKYLDAREKAGIKETDAEKQESFMKYLVEDRDLDF